MKQSEDTRTARSTATPRSTRPGSDPQFSGDPALDGPVRDAPEMLRRLADSDRVRQIFIRHVFRYFMGRNETPGDAVSLQEAEKAYLDNGGSFKALLVSLLSSESSCIEPCLRKETSYAKSETPNSFEGPIPWSRVRRASTVCEFSGGAGRGRHAPPP